MKCRIGVRKTIRSRRRGDRRGHIGAVAAALLLTSALTGVAAAAPVPTERPAAKTQERPHAAERVAARHARPLPSVVAPEVENMTVSARRRAHGTMITLGSADIQRAVAGTNPLKVLGAQPGIMFQSADPQGVDTWSSQIYMHGFMQNQISTTLDDVPLGELVYRNYNGLNPIEAISSENVGRLDVSTGAGAESVASTNNLGGSIEYVSSDPKTKAGGQVNQTFGSNSMFHTFARVDSGALNDTGTRFYVSYSRNDMHKWKGGGNDFTQQVNAKLVQPVGADSSVSAYFDWSDLHEYLYQDYSLDILHNGGYFVDNYYNGRYSGYANAYNAALGNYPSSLDRISDKADAAYYDGASNINDYFGYLKGDFALTDRLRWKTTAYGHGQDSILTWSNPFYPSPNGAPMFEQVKQPSIQRFGILSALHYDIARNHIETGVWYENNRFVSSMFGYEQPLPGQGSPINSVGGFANLTPFMQLYGQTINTNTFTTYAQDTWNVLPNLALHFGFKSLLNVSRAGNAYYNTGYYGNDASVGGVGLTTFRAFLPHISGDWHFLKHHELYFDIAENVHAYPQAQFKTAASPFAVTQSAYDMARPGLKPESDWAYAVGYRYSDRLMDATIHAYRVNFFNRLQMISSGAIINPQTIIANVGGITMNGVDAGLTLRPLRGLSFTNSVSYNHATYDQNMESGGVVYHTRGVQVVAYPRVMYKTALSYRWRDLEAHVDAAYTTRRNLSYVGDAKVPAYWIANFGMNYRLTNLVASTAGGRFLKGLELGFNIYNLSNARYVSTMGENGFSLSGDYQSFLVGAPRQYFGSIKAEF
ncbi:TonB-dependent receptor plug domain-containing protein [Gluconacetobacter aggeris]|uniref:TonB-dependent receptor plug domain-containing protein n=2 Tax=Gluconacetobacter aggeris TaxID=1286186 RepID=A0A7W4NW92_9PROT|nr:TonB-dependent receptor plug domain-containing protein [Gluconacetobacter aggeris]